MILQLLGYAPDADPSVLGVLVSASHVVPSMRGFKAAPSPASAGVATLAATCQGAANLMKIDGTSRFFAATTDKLYEASSGSWTDRSRVAAYAGSAASRWRFAQFGDTSLAVNGSNTVQASSSAGFSDVPGSPIASLIETVGAFVFVFNTNSANNGWQCAGINDYTSWTVAAATQATSGTLTASPGPILAAKRFGQQIAVYKKTSTYLGTYCGSPNVWQFDLMPGIGGALSQEAVADIGSPDRPMHVFMGEDNFYMFDGAKITPIGTDRVKISVFTELQMSRYYVAQALHDRKNALVYFYYPAADSDMPDKCVVYNYRTDKWGTDDVRMQMVAQWSSSGITYDSVGSSYTTYDNLPDMSHDVAFLGGQTLHPAIFDSKGVLKTLTGVATTSSYTTGDIGDDEKEVTLSRVRPRFITQPTSGQQVNYYRQLPGAIFDSDTAVNLSQWGTFDRLREARWHRLEHSYVGDWELSNISIEYSGDSYE